MSAMKREDFLHRLSGIKLLSLDTDGVLTDGGLYYTDAGEELRKFNVKDGLGIRRVQAAGVIVAIITASASPAIAFRGRYLGVELVYLETRDKLVTLVELCDSLGLGLDQVAHMGDDLNDLPVFAEVGLAIAVADAMPDNLKAADQITEKIGGAGAVREICDLLVTAHLH